MQIDIATTKLVFNTHNRPELNAAIVQRLVELGATPPSYVERDSTNVSLNWQRNSIHQGGACADSSCFDGHTVATLADLYDVEDIPEPKHLLTINDTTVEISEDSFNAIKAAFS